MRYGKSLIAAGALVFTASGDALAQVCLGYPTIDGQYALAGTVGFADGAMAYGGALNANFTGPFAAEAGYQYIDIEDVETSGNNFFGRLGYELEVPSVSICPFAGIGYADASEEFEDVELSVSVLSVPVGVGIGKRFEASPSLFFDLFAQPHILWARADIELEGPGGGEIGEDGSETEAGIDIGANLGTSRFFVGGGVNVTTAEDSDPTFNLRIGIVLGGNR